MRIQKIVSLWLCAVLLLFPLSGCGAQGELATIVNDNIITVYNRDTHTLHIKGFGELKNLYPRAWYPEHSPYFVEKNTHVKRLVIEEGITSLNNCFNDMAALKEVELPSSLKSIERSFMYCTALKELFVPGSVKKIADYSFNACVKLEKIQFDDTIEITHDSVFNGLSALKTVSIPQNSVLCHAFNNCENLEEITIEANVTFHDYALTADESCYMSFDSIDEGCKVYIDKSVFNDLRYRGIPGGAHIQK